MMLGVNAETQLMFFYYHFGSRLALWWKVPNQPNFLHSLQPGSYSSALFFKLPLPLLLAKFLPIILKIFLPSHFFVCLLAFSSGNASIPFSILLWLYCNFTQLLLPPHSFPHSPRGSEPHPYDIQQSFSC